MTIKRIEIGGHRIRVPEDVHAAALRIKRRFGLPTTEAAYRLLIGAGLVFLGDKS